MERNDQYPGLDVSQSGKSLRYQIRRAGYNIREIQDYLHLSCPQPVYRWLRGKTLPSVDHLYALSRLLGYIWKIFWPDAGKNRFTWRHFTEKSIWFLI